MSISDSENKLPEPSVNFCPQIYNKIQSIIRCHKNTFPLKKRIANPINGAIIILFIVFFNVIMLCGTIIIMNYTKFWRVRENVMQL